MYIYTFLLYQAYTGDIREISSRVEMANKWSQDDP